MLLLVSASCTSFSCLVYNLVLNNAIYLLPTGMQVLFMVHLEKHWTQTPGSETRKRMCYLEIDLLLYMLSIYFDDSCFAHKSSLVEQKLSDEPS